MSPSEHCHHHHKGQMPWSKGKTKETDDRIASSSKKISETRKQLFNEGKLNVSGERNGMYRKHKEWWSKDGKSVFVNSCPGEG